MEGKPEKKLIEIYKYGKREMSFVVCKTRRTLNGRPRDVNRYSLKMVLWPGCTTVVLYIPELIVDQLQPMSNMQRVDYSIQLIKSQLNYDLNFTESGEAEAIWRKKG